MSFPPLLDVGATPIQPGLLVVPEGKTNRTGGLYVGGTKDTGQFHDDGGARTGIVGGLAEPVPVHVRTDDVHLVRIRRPDLGAVDLRP